MNDSELTDLLAPLTEDDFAALVAEAHGEARELDRSPEVWDDEFWAFTPGEE